MQQHRHGTPIGRIFTDIHYPCASVPSAQSVFYRKYKKPQMNTDERRYLLASEFGKLSHRKGHKECKVHLMISFWILKTTEGTEDTEKRKKTLCSLCSPWSIIAAGEDFGGFNARAPECSIFMRGETIGGGDLA